MTFRVIYIGSYDLGNDKRGALADEIVDWLRSKGQIALKFENVDPGRDFVASGGDELTAVCILTLEAIERMRGR